MAKVELNAKQEKLKAVITECLTELRKDMENHWNNLTTERRNEIFTMMGDAAHELHMSLTPHPKHHRYMIKNRGMKPEDPKFYYHIHPVEDLLAYLDDIHANDDPEDQTIGTDFEFRVYSRRWGHKDTYKITRTAEGWYVRFQARNGNGDKGARPILYQIFDNDCINYPEELPGYMEWLWNQAEEQGLTQIEVQKALDDLAEWVSTCEMSSPSGIFGGFK